MLYQLSYTPKERGKRAYKGPPHRAQEPAERSVGKPFSSRFPTG